MCVGADIHPHPITRPVSHQSLAYRRLLADKALEGILAQRGDDPQDHFFVYHLIEHRDLVKQPHSVLLGLRHLNHLGGADHPL